jgi:peptidoglycan/xylan/chitin deacetylase (PgdA/CDA1 family)
MVAIVSIEFDDCFEETVLSVLKKLEKHNLKATFAVPANKLGLQIEGGKVAEEKLIKRIIKEGHEIASHTLNHSLLAKRNIFSLSNFRNLLYLRKLSYLLKALGKKSSTIAKDLYGEIKESKELLERLVKVISFTYPGGAYTPKIKNIVKKYYKSARTTERGFNSPRTDRFELKSMLWDRNTSVKEANQWVDLAISKNLWLIETLHLVSNKENSYEYSSKADKFFKHLEYLSEKIKEGEIILKTRGDLLK